MIYTISKGVSESWVSRLHTQLKTARWQAIVPAIGGGLVSMWLLLIGVSIAMNQNPLTFPSSLEAFQTMTRNAVSGRVVDNTGQVADVGQDNVGSSATQSGTVAWNISSTAVATSPQSDSSANQSITANPVDVQPAGQTESAIPVAPDVPGVGSGSDTTPIITIPPTTDPTNTDPVTPTIDLQPVIEPVQTVVEPVIDTVIDTVL